MAMRAKFRLSICAALALLTVPAASAQASTGHRVDLGSGRIDGHAVLGRTVAEVIVSFGRPDFRAGTRTSYRIGWGTSTNFSVEVLFRRSAGALHAWSVVFERGPVRDTKIGELLGRRSAALQATIRSRYSDTYKLLRGYHCQSSGTCAGEFVERSGTLHLSFGTQPVRGTWLTVWTAE